MLLGFCVEGRFALWAPGDPRMLDHLHIWPSVGQTCWELCCLRCFCVCLELSTACIYLAMALSIYLVA